MKCKINGCNHNQQSNGFCQRHLKVESDLLPDSYALSLGELNVTSQGEDIVVTVGKGANSKRLLTLTIDQAIDFGINLRAVAVCAKNHR